MYCLKCGQGLPDDAAFCLKCGHRQNELGESSVPRTGHQVCQISIVERGTRGWWEARSDATKIAQSAEYSITRELLYCLTFQFGKIGSEIHQRHLELVSHLASYGWTPVSHDERGHVVMMQKSMG